MPGQIMPRSVLFFERLGYFTVLVGGGASIWANWQVAVKFFAQYSVLYPILVVVSFGAQIGWIWIIARKRQNWARLISIFLIAGAVFAEILNVKSNFETNPTAYIVQAVVYVLWIIQFSFLFTREAKAWFVFSPSAEIENHSVSPTEA